MKGRNEIGKDSTHSQPTLLTFGSTSSHQPVSLLTPQRSLLLGPLGHCVILRASFSKQLPLIPLVMSTFLSGMAVVSLLVLAAPAREEVLGKLKPGSGRRQRDYCSREMRLGQGGLRRVMGQEGSFSVRGKVLATHSSCILS